MAEDITRVSVDPPPELGIQHPQCVLKVSRVQPLDGLALSQMHHFVNEGRFDGLKATHVEISDLPWWRRWFRALTFRRQAVRWEYTFIPANRRSTDAN